MAKVISAAEAAALIGDGMTVAVDGFIGFSLAEDILCEMEERFLREGHPRDLRLVNVAGLGGDGRRRGINHFAHRGMLSRLLCSNLSLANAIYPHISAGDFALFMAPQGVMSHMMRAIAGKKPGVLTSVGLRTFVDPRRDGCRMNQKAWESGEEVVQLVELAGQEQLFSRRSRWMPASSRAALPMPMGTSAWKRRPFCWSSTRWPLPPTTVAGWCLPRWINWFLPTP